MPVFLSIDPNAINKQGVIVPDATNTTPGVVKLSDIPAGGVTSLVAGPGIILTPNPITGAGTIAAAPVPPGVFPVQIPDTSVVDPNLYTGQIVWNIATQQFAFSFLGAWIYVAMEAS